MQKAKSAAGSDAPDRVLYHAWSWQLMTERDWVRNLTPAIKLGEGNALVAKDIAPYSRTVR